jgi:hypothetical protein
MSGRNFDRAIAICLWVWTVAQALTIVNQVLDLLARGR